MANSFRYEFTGKEFSYFLFKKKVCPKCGGQMKKIKCAETFKGEKINTASVPLYIQGREIKSYYYSFICKKCNSEFTLSELVK